MSLNLIQVQGYGESVAGLAQLPVSILILLLSPRMGSFVDRYGPRIPLIAGPIIVALGFFALAVAGHHQRTKRLLAYVLPWAGFDRRWHGLGGRAANHVGDGVGAAA